MDFITKARKVHGDKYDYSKVEYINNSTKVCIICPEHGEFWQTPNVHLSGHGCPKCYGNIKKTTQQFIEEAKRVHGDKYDYSKVEYVNNRTKVCIICPIHGEFWQTPKNHIKGQGCNKCAIKYRAENNSLTKEEFIKRAKKVHGDRYDYSKVEYVNINTEVCIIDKKYGEFWQKPVYHLSYKGHNLIRNTEDFIQRAKEIHGDKYDYSKVEYVNSHTKICIVCPEHGEFWQTTNDHLNGRGCPKCGVEKRSKKRLYTNERFIEKARKIHGNKYDYSKTKYIKSNEKVEIICPKHGSFYQTATDHLQGAGCPRCSHHISNGEKEIIDFIDTLGLEYIISDRNILKGKEIDIYIPSKKIAIEYDGLLWHSEKFGKDKNYHLNKTIECEKQGIRLIHIFEDEWTFKKEITKSMLLEIFGLLEEKIILEKCSCKRVSSNEATKFINENYIFEKNRATYHYGLYYNNELVSIMSFKEDKRNKGIYQLLNFCKKLYIDIGNGGLMLLNCFVEDLKPKQIVANADLRWTIGDEYKKIGFNYKHNISPNYTYVIGQKREKRSKIKEKFQFIRDFNKTDLLKENGIYRIYDCGVKVFFKDIYIKK